MSYKYQIYRAAIISSKWDKKLQNPKDRPPSRWKVLAMGRRAGERVYQGHQPHEEGVSTLKNEAWIPGQNPSERPQEKDRKERTRSKCELTQQSQKIVAQQILKNNQMVAKYDKLDAQLQGVTFE